MISDRFINPDRPAVNQIWAYYKYMRDGLADDWRSVQRHGPAGLTALPLEMQGLSLKEAFTLLINELEDEVTLALISSVEASLRVDFGQRAGKKKKDNVSRAFREIYKTHKTRARLPDLLDIWRDVGGVDRERISAVKKLIEYRHWLAHGRHWIVPSKKYDPHEALRVADQLFDELEDLHGLSTYR